jgi:DNA-binding Lrp family transcriptional regulator
MNDREIDLQSGVRLDETDESLLALLRRDARLPIAQLAKELTIPRGQLYSRLARLEEAGIVAGYTVRLGEAYAAGRIRAHMMIKTAPRWHREVENALEHIARVQAVHAISGEYDIIAMLEAEDSRHLNDLIDDIGMLEGIERTSTSVILATKLER